MLSVGGTSGAGGRHLRCEWEAPQGVGGRHLRCEWKAPPGVGGRHLRCEWKAPQGVGGRHLRCRILKTGSLDLIRRSCLSSTLHVLPCLDLFSRVVCARCRPSVAQEVEKRTGLLFGLDGVVLLWPGHGWKVVWSVPRLFWDSQVCCRCECRVSLSGSDSHGMGRGRCDQLRIRVREHLSLYNRFAQHAPGR